MIQLVNRFDQYSYSIPAQAADSVISAGLEEGEFLTPTSGKEWVKTNDGTKPSFISLTSNRVGRDQLGGKVTNKLVQLLYGKAVLRTNKVSGAITAGAPLYNLNGTLVPAGTSGLGSSNLVICAYALEDIGSDGFVQIALA